MPLLLSHKSNVTTCELKSKTEVVAFTASLRRMLGAPPAWTWVG